MTSGRDVTQVPSWNMPGGTKEDHDKRPSLPWALHEARDTLLDDEWPWRNTSTFLEYARRNWGRPRQTLLKTAGVPTRKRATSWRCTGLLKQGCGKWANWVFLQACCDVLASHVKQGVPDHLAFYYFLPKFPASFRFASFSPVINI